MADTDATAPETTPQEPLTPASSASTPSQDNASQADVEALKAQMQKLEMERNLLRKKVDSTSKELEEKTKKELEEKEDWRSLAERSQAELAEFRKERETAETKQAVEEATSEVFKDFDPKVVEVAQSAGLSATDNTDEAKAALKTRLEAIQAKVGITPSPRVSGNNPAPRSEAPDFDPMLIGKQMRFDDRSIREKAIKTAVGAHPQVKAFREFAKKQNNVAEQYS